MNICVPMPSCKSLRRPCDLRRGGLSTRLFTSPPCKRDFSGTEECLLLWFPWWLQLGFLGYFGYSGLQSSKEAREKQSPLYPCNCPIKQPKVLNLLTNLYCAFAGYLSPSYLIGPQFAINAQEYILVCFISLAALLH